MLRYLAESDNYKISSEDETVYLDFKTASEKQPIIIGDFYGNPRCAIILEEEDYVIMGGCGLIIYKIEEPFGFYRYGQKEPVQFKEFFRNPDDIWWISGLTQDWSEYNGRLFSFVALNKEGYSLYKMNAVTLEIQKVGTFQDSVTK